MPNPMDNAFVNTSNEQNIDALIQQIKQNPATFEDYVRKTNPQGYQRALQIRNLQNPQAVIMQMMQSSGFNPNILGKLGLR